MQGKWTYADAVAAMHAAQDAGHDVVVIQKDDGAYRVRHVDNVSGYKIVAR